MNRGAINQSTPTPEQFRVFVNNAKNLPDAARGEQRVKNGTKKLLEQLGMGQKISPANLVELTGRGYGQAVALLQQMNNVVEED